MFEKTTNTLADRTRPAIFLGMKSNSYGSGHFFTLDTKQVIVREQWKPLQIDLGTINLLNSIAKKGPLMPKNLRLIFKCAEIHGEDYDQADEVPEKPKWDDHVRIGGDRNEMPDPTVNQPSESKLSNHIGR